MSIISSSCRKANWMCIFESSCSLWSMRLTLRFYIFLSFFSLYFSLWETPEKHLLFSVIRPCLNAPTVISLSLSQLSSVCSTCCQTALPVGEVRSWAVRATHGDAQVQSITSKRDSVSSGRQGSQPAGTTPRENHPGSEAGVCQSRRRRVSSRVWVMAQGKQWEAAEETQSRYRRGSFTPKMQYNQQVLKLLEVYVLVWLCLSMWLNICACPYTLKN